MKHYWLALFATMTAFAASPAANASQYIAASLMLVSPSDSKYELGSITGKFGLKGGVGGSIAYGTRFDSGMAFEVEMAHRPIKMKSITFDSDLAIGGATVDAGTYSLTVNPKLSSLSLMANLMYQMGNDDSWGGISPYFGAGIGVASVKYAGFTVGDYTDPNATAGGMAFQFLAGVAYPLSDAMEVRLGYKYFSIGNLDFGITETEAKGHNFELGAVFKF